MSNLPNFSKILTCKKKKKSLKLGKLTKYNNIWCFNFGEKFILENYKKN